MKRMTDEQQKTLVNFITEQMSAVRNPNEIYEELKKAGWAEDRIRQAFLALHTQVLPKAVREQATAQPPAPAPVAPKQPLPQPSQQPQSRTSFKWASLRRIFTKNKRSSGDKNDDSVHPAPPA